MFPCLYAQYNILLYLLFGIVSVVFSNEHELDFYSLIYFKVCWITYSFHSHIYTANCIVKQTWCIDFVRETSICDNHNKNIFTDQ